MHTNSVIDEQRMAHWRASRFNPIRFLTPERLSRLLDDYDGGRLAECVNAWDVIIKREDVLRNVYSKRVSAISKRTFEIVIDKGAKEAGLETEAQAHKECLEYFYKNLKCTSALDGNQRGGFRLMVKQMMSAEAMGYAAHEIIWQPETEGITAQFKFVPLQFFENHTGNLQFLKTDGELYGVPLEEGGWMVTCGNALMIACSILYIYKRITLNQSNRYGERNAQPAFVYKTDAQEGSPEHNAAMDLVAKLSEGFAGVMRLNDILEALQLGATGQVPYPATLERLDRAMAALWRGADLSTISAGSGTGQGASLQWQESDALEQDDGMNLSETLNEWVDKKAIEWKFGPGTKPLAYVKIIVPPKIDVDQQIKIDNHFLETGVEIGIEETRERFQRPKPDPKDDVLEIQPPVMAPGAGGFSGLRPGASRNSFGNEAQRQLHGQSQTLIRNSLKRMAEAQAETLRPVFDRLKAVFEFEGPAWEMAMDNFRTDLPNMLKEIDVDPPTARVLEGTITAAMFNGVAEGMVDRRIKK